MAYHILVIVIFLFPGILAHHYYQYFIKKEMFSFGVVSRGIIISVLAYACRGLIGIFQGYGDAPTLVYFDNIENIVKYILLSFMTSFLLINSYIYLEQKLLPLWKENQSLEKKEEPPNV